MQITFTESSITTLRPGRHRDRTQPGLSGEASRQHPTRRCPSPFAKAAIQNRES